MNETKPTSISPRHYDQVPDYCFKNGESIIDIGCMNGLNASLSRHRDYFLKARKQGTYQGVDIKQYNTIFLNPIAVCDILEYKPTRTYDLVLALHVVEHIPFEDWPKLFSILHDLVAPNGYLVVATPFKQKNSEKEGHPEHVVFGIHKETLSSFMPDSIFYKRRVHYRHFREQGERMIWAIGRTIWRTLRRHKLRFKWVHELIAIEKWIIK